ncbi:MAG: hypothetical protein N0C88_21735 [Candidatus Thiodiazotropha lotti]|uniref:Uncharacterized protein n=1 Tax=Candidatus Thiodiazotropha lotti TaxID=2792787 RepID=A0A9E4N2E7_9GAMM|nr:hypothetical protein [Candidatus Thiodiazotropha lotti]MCW4205927.1 hypothetical protein [Candidatus Thiodiazotropha lotti]
MEIHYLNTDLELESPKDLTPIVEAFGEDVVNLYNGKARGHYLASFEIASSEGSPDSKIQYYCMLAESLFGEEKILWEGCYSKVFDIGYEGGTGHKSYTDEVRANTLERVVALGASIRVTIYPMNFGLNEENQP